jgi:hypothetical protein
VVVALLFARPLTRIIREERPRRASGGRRVHSAKPDQVVRSSATGNLEPR